MNLGLAPVWLGFTRPNEPRKAKSPLPHPLEASKSHQSSSEWAGPPGAPPIIGAKAAIVTRSLRQATEVVASRCWRASRGAGPAQQSLARPKTLNQSREGPTRAALKWPAGDLALHSCHCSACSHERTRPARATNANVLLNSAGRRRVRIRRKRSRRTAFKFIGRAH